MQQKMPSRIKRESTTDLFTQQTKAIPLYAKAYQYSHC